MEHKITGIKEKNLPSFSIEMSDGNEKQIGEEFLADIKLKMKDMKEVDGKKICTYEVLGMDESSPEEEEEQESGKEDDEEGEDMSPMMNKMTQDKSMRVNKAVADMEMMNKKGGK